LQAHLANSPNRRSDDAAEFSYESHWQRLSGAVAATQEAQIRWWAFITHELGSKCSFNQGFGAALTANSSAHTCHHFNAASVPQRSAEVTLAGFIPGSRIPNSFRQVLPVAIQSGV
jgi:hypothetical protein